MTSRASCRTRAERGALLPFTTPTAYGLGKSGWVTPELPDGPVPVELFKAWIDESYRAQAPKRLAGPAGQHRRAQVLRRRRDDSPPR